MVHAVSNGSGVESNGRDGEHRSVKRVGCAIQGGGLDGGVDGEREAEPRRQHGLGCHFELLQLGLLQSLGLGPPVLEPDFDLCLCEVEGAGELGPLGDGQVLLLAELALQGQQLRGGERGAGLPIRLVLPQRAGSGAQVSCKEGRAGYHSGRDTPGLCCLSQGSPPGVPRVPSKHGLLQRGGSANLVLTDLQLTALQLVKGDFFPSAVSKGTENSQVALGVTSQGSKAHQETALAAAQLQESAKNATKAGDSQKESPALLQDFPTTSDS